LTDALKEPVSEAGPLRFHAATALGRIGPDAKEAVPGLVDLLKDKKLGPARRVAAEALGAIGPDAKNAVPALKDAASDGEISDAAAKALSRIQGN
jgi:HEAT repeat protein